MVDLTPQHRLAIYGTLAPGRENHAQVRMIDGTWRDGVVRGWLSEDGWGVTYGFPGLKLDPDGEAINVQVLESPDLPAHWARLDAFEGDEYARVIAAVETADDTIAACVYVVNP